MLDTTANIITKKAKKLFTGKPKVDRKAKVKKAKAPAAPKVEAATRQGRVRFEPNAHITVLKDNPHREGCADFRLFGMTVEEALGKTYVDAKGKRRESPRYALNWYANHGYIKVEG
ncbi:MAG: hypothetical protein WA441_11315 [Methyloceanibacter sp.]